MRRGALALVALLPWLLFAGLVAAAWWLIAFDGDPDNNGTGWICMGLALPCLFAAAGASRWRRRRIEAEYELERLARAPAGSSGPLDWLNWP